MDLKKNEKDAHLITKEIINEMINEAMDENADKTLESAKSILLLNEPIFIQNQSIFEEKNFCCNLSKEDLNNILSSPSSNHNYYLKKYHLQNLFRSDDRDARSPMQTPFSAQGRKLTKLRFICKRDVIKRFKKYFRIYSFFFFFIYYHDAIISEK